MLLRVPVRKMQARLMPKTLQKELIVALMLRQSPRETLRAPSMTETIDTMMTKEVATTKTMTDATVATTIEEVVPTIDAMETIKRIAMAAVIDAMAEKGAKEAMTIDADMAAEVIATVAKETMRTVEETITTIIMRVATAAARGDMEAIKMTVEAVMAMVSPLASASTKTRLTLSRTIASTTRMTRNSSLRSLSKSSPHSSSKSTCFMVAHAMSSPLMAWQNWTLLMRARKWSPS